MADIKVMMVDPWGTYNMYLYTNGLCENIAEQVDLVLWTNYYFPQEKELNYPVKRIFFKRSEAMRQGMLRNIIRICEYYCAYFALLRELKIKRYDLIHIQWLLHYKSDIFFLNKIKKLGPKIIYTAHNVLPHRNKKKHYDDLYKIYSKVDHILVHGEKIRQEFTELFAVFENKVSLQRHGAFAGQDLSYNMAMVNNEIIARLNEPEKIFIFFGNIFYNKGVDRLAKIWLDHFKDEQDYLLIIAGKKDGNYKELDALETELIACSNIIYISHFIENNLLNFLIDQSQLVLLPYRDASMSGVLLTAAEFKKPVLATKTGAISEYLIDGENSFLAENSDDHYTEKLKFIVGNISNDQLAQMGVNLHTHIRQNFSWENIGNELVEKTYRTTIN